MKQAFVTMLAMQDRMNQRIHPDWIDQHFAWYRAIWIECGELMDHFGYKWWKKQEPDLDQVRLEVIDIWHFGMSALFRAGVAQEQIAREMADALQGYHYQGKDVRDSTETLALDCLQHRSFSVTAFWDLLHAVGMDFDELFRQYVGKNVLNFFRQDHGYKEGTYIKQWQGREDNEHLVDIINSLDSGSERFSDEVYQALESRYREVSA